MTSGLDNVRPTARAVTGPRLTVKDAVDAGGHRRAVPNYSMQEGDC